MEWGAQFMRQHMMKRTHISLGCHLGRHIPQPHDASHVCMQSGIAVFYL
jgi:hypothetical protein